MLPPTSCCFGLPKTQRQEHLPLIYIYIYIRYIFQITSEWGHSVLHPFRRWVFAPEHLASLAIGLTSLFLDVSPVFRRLQGPRGYFRRRWNHWVCLTENERPKNLKITTWVVFWVGDLGKIHLNQTFMTLDYLQENPWDDFGGSSRWFSGVQDWKPSPPIG